MQKKCSKCKQVKNLDEFNKWSRAKDGHHYNCRRCIAVNSKKIYDKYMGKAREYHQGTKKKITQQCNVCNRVKTVENFRTCGQTKGIPHYRKKCNKCISDTPGHREKRYKRRNFERELQQQRKKRAKLKGGDGFRYESGERYSSYQYNKHLNQFLKRHGQRKCAECKLIKTFNEFTKNEDIHHKLSAVGHYCRKCKNIKDKIYQKSHPKVMDRCRETSAIRQNERCDNLHDTYIKNLIVAGSPLTFADVPDELVKAKRQYIKLRRETNNNDHRKKRKYNERKEQESTKDR